MPDDERPDEPEQDLRNVIAFSRPSKGEVHEGRLLDPHLPLPGPIKRARGKGEVAPPRQGRAAKKEGENRYELYLNNLLAYNGDPIKALSTTLNISEEEAAEKQVDLHREIVAAGNVDRALDRMLNDYDLTQPAVLNVLRMHLFQRHTPAASLKAADMVREMWGDTTVGETIEDLVRLALSED